jgi:hypothetical protein
MSFTACLRCGSTDLRTPGASDPNWEGSMTLNLVCRRCGYQGIPATFDDAESYHSFRQAREALWRPGNGHDREPDALAAPRFPERARVEERPRKKDTVTRALFGLLGFVFFLAALGAFSVAVGTGNLSLLPEGFVALLFSVPLVALAARRPRP